MTSTDGDHSPSVLIVDDDRLFADAVRVILQDRGMERVDVEQDPEPALRIARRGQPDLILVEADRRDGLGGELCAALVSAGLETKVVAFSRGEKGIAEARRAGVDGFLSKASAPDELVGSLMRIADGARPPQHLARAVEPPNGDVLTAMLKKRLTMREREMLDLLMQGFTSREIASALDLTQNTVRTHVQSLLKKLQVHSRVEAAAFAAKHHLVDR